MPAAEESTTTLQQLATARRTRSSIKFGMLNLMNPFESELEDTPMTHRNGATDSTTTPDPEKKRKSSKKKKTCWQQTVNCLLSLRVRTMLVLLGIIAVMMMIFLAILISVFATSFKKLETSTTEDATKRVSRAIFDDFDQQMTRLLSYAIWTDTANLMNNFTQEDWEPYREENYRYDYMQSAQGTNLALFYYNDGTLAAYAGFDFTTGANISVPQELASLPLDHPLMVNMSDIEHRAGGYIVAKNYMDYGNMIFAVTAAPIQADEDDAQTAGVLVYATMTQPDKVMTLSVRSQLCITVYTMEDILSKSYLSKYRGLSKGSYVPVDISNSVWENDESRMIEVLDQSSTSLQNRECWRVRGGERMAAFRVYSNIFGEPEIVIRADVNRYINDLGWRSFGISYGMIVVGCVLMAISVLLFIERAVLHPILALSHGVQEIAETNNIEARVPENSSSEIGRLTRRVNEMLSSLDYSQKKIKEEHGKLSILLTKVSIEEQKARTIMNGIPDFILTVEKSGGVILNANNAFYNKLRFPPNDVENKMLISSLFKNMTHNDILKNFQQLAEQEQSIETAIFTKFKSEIPVQVSVSIIKLLVDEQLVESFVVMCRNMSEHHEMKEKMNAHEEQLKTLATQIEFETMLRTPFYKEAFKEFCRKEMSEENILFLEAVEDYRLMTKTHERALKQQEIIDRFLKENGSSPLNLSHSVLQRELFSIEKGCGQIDLFDQVEIVVRGMVMSDTFARFNAENRRGKENAKKKQETSPSILEQDK